MKKKDQESLRKIVIIGLVLVVGYLGYQSMTGGSSPFSEASETFSAPTGGLNDPLIGVGRPSVEESVIGVGFFPVLPPCKAYESDQGCEMSHDRLGGCTWKPDIGDIGRCLSGLKLDLK